MKYLMNVTIKNPNHKSEMCSDLLLKLNCYFAREEEGYGKKTWLSIHGVGDFEQCIDLRYDKNYHRGKEKQYLEYWARNYWTGKNGAWEIKSLNITELE